MLVLMLVLLLYWRRCIRRWLDSSSRKECELIVRSSFNQVQRPHQTINIASTVTVANLLKGIATVDDRTYIY